MIIVIHQQDDESLKIAVEELWLESEDFLSLSIFRAQTAEKRS